MNPCGVSGRSCHGVTAAPSLVSGEPEMAADAVPFESGPRRLAAGGVAGAAGGVAGGALHGECISGGVPEAAAVVPAERAKSCRAPGGVAGTEVPVEAANHGGVAEFSSGRAPEDAAESASRERA